MAPESTELTARQRALHPTSVQTAAEVAAGPGLSVSIDSGTLYGAPSIEDAMRFFAGAGRVSRREAMQTPAVKRARDLICSTSSLPLVMQDAKGKPVTDWTLVNQPEENRPASATWADMFEDMLFEKYAHFEITHFAWHGRPAHVARMAPGTFSKGDGGYWINKPGERSRWVPEKHVIIIESPNDPLLVVGARAIRVLSLLEAAGLNAASGMPPVDYFTPADPNVEPFDEPGDAVAFLDSWLAARQARRTAFVPGNLKYNGNSIDAKSLQLIEARQEQIVEIARLTGIDAEDLGVSTTSRTYFNAQDRRRHLLDFTFGPYRRAVEERLSMADITPAGYRVRFDVAEFGRADDFTTAQTDQMLLTAGIVTVNEVRVRRGLEPLPETTPSREEVTA